jgi:quercetin dioxygenase-like cupin family protein/alkylhydroperoxidase/carboxymuconolactone decarboxylase family protein YurZ
MKKLKVKRLTLIWVIATCLISQNLNGQTNPETNQALTSKQKQIVPISAFMAKGDQDGLSFALNGGLNAGLTINETNEVLMHLYAYCGFPRSLNALSTFQNVLEQRRNKGIEDQKGREASPLPTNKSSFELGSEVLVELVGTSDARGVRLFAPAVDSLLKKHLFGDLFGRDVLDYQSREIATISALSSMRGTEAQLGSHIRVALNIGMTADQLKDIASELTEKVGFKEGQVMQAKMNEILKIAAPTESTVMPMGESLFPKGNRIESDHFIGNVWLHMIIRDDSTLYAASGNVTFEPGARTNWHLHPGGQILMITEGLGYYQERGEPKQIIRKGEVIICQPNVEHWHGASKDQSMTHMAMSINTQHGGARWLEPVTDEEFNRGQD